MTARLTGVLVAIALASRCLAQDGVHRFDDELERVRAQIDVPGAAAAVADADRLLAVAACGLRSRQAGARVTFDDRFHVGSLTKAMTATVAAVLVERGKIAWDDTLAQVLDASIVAQLPETHHAVTLAQLLEHRSGLPDDRAGGPSLLRMSMIDAADPLWRARATVMAFAQGSLADPGADMRYANANYIAAGAMLEAATDQPWEHLMRTLLFEPLRMDSAGFGPPARSFGPGAEPDQPLGHRNGYPVPPGPFADNPAVLGPAGTVHCGMADLARFAQAHLKAALGAEGFVTAEMAERLHADPNADGYALGWGVRRAGGDVERLAHAGSNTMFYAMMIVDVPAERVYVFAFNAVPEDADEATRQVRRVLAGVASELSAPPAP